MLDVWDHFEIWKTTLQLLSVVGNWVGKYLGSRWVKAGERVITSLFQRAKTIWDLNYGYDDSLISLAIRVNIIYSWSSSFLYTKCDVKLVLVPEIPSLHALNVMDFSGFPLKADDRFHEMELSRTDCYVYAWTTNLHSHTSLPPPYQTQVQC